ncbi:MAG: RNA 2'-phosphotransferase [Gammaproteobacteria bacterium CG12_big_fil_rev_8_21_14_0_65_46_12]|nr:MAG: RNA 2'-phosphotransferase [Gammaproteobacteria bacterium CG12_big_fil_rev_8_21_14_0_65_46_12]
MSASNSELKKASKFLSYVLRHCPDDIGLTLDRNGWAFISELIDKAKPQIVLTPALIKQVVETSDKQRFKISDDGQQIRANQGHSIKVDLELIPREPPAVLFHGTATRFLDSIKQEGLKPGQRHHVHLSADATTAKAVGQRYGKPVILKINSGSMSKQGYEFFLSDNNVWLTEHVPEQFISVT